MASPHAAIYQALERDWLIGLDRDYFQAQFHQRHTDLVALPSPRPILIIEPDPTAFLATFLAAVATHHTAILGSPHWTSQERQQAEAIALPPPSSPPPPLPLILIPTGGTSGQIRFATHTWDTLSASVWGFQQFFERSPIHSCCVLPLYHVSGLMQVMRSLLTQGTLAVYSFKSLEVGLLPQLDPHHFFLSLVPTQLQRLLSQSVTIRWLQRFHTILLGGAPPWPSLLDQARQQSLRLAPTYGMTETASQIATQKPDDFLSGKPGYQILPHAQVSLELETVQIQAKSLALGYFPEFFPKNQPFMTDDMGFLDETGRLHLNGRGSDKIITGGENVFPAEVEAAIRATGLVADVAVVGVGDRHWGEAITAIYVPQHSQVTPTQLEAALNSTLSRFKHPKHWLAIPSLPRNDQGKVNRLVLQKWIEEGRGQEAEGRRVENPEG